MDPLSDALTLLDLRAAFPSRFEASGHWALQFQEYQHIKVGAILAGQCWMIAEGAQPMLLRQGDCYLLASGRPYAAASDLETEPVDGQAIFAAVWPEAVRYNVVEDDPDRTVLVSGAVAFDETAAALLLDCLPPRVRIPADSRRARALRPILQLLAEEASRDAPGSLVMREQLTQILFIQALRTLLIADDHPGGKLCGWLGALADDRVGTALRLIHRDLARRWTLDELAAAVNMSRSRFALRFKDLVGLPPLDYAARWRIHSAARVLRSTNRTVSSIAAEFNYASESAFSNAFKRVTGDSPNRYRRSVPLARSADGDRPPSAAGLDTAQAMSIPTNEASNRPAPCRTP